MFRFFRKIKPLHWCLFLGVSSFTAVGVQFKNPRVMKPIKDTLFNLSSSMGVPVGRFAILSDDMVRSFESVHALRRENTRLSEELEKLRFEMTKLGRRLSRADQLEKILKFLSAYKSEGVAVEIVSRGFQVWDKSVVVRGGTKDGFRPNMPVLSADGIIGKTLQCGVEYSEIMLLTNAGFAMSGVIRGQQDVLGMIHGQDGPCMKFDYVKPDKKVSVGDRLVSSGDDEIFPPDYPIGSVASVRSTGLVFQEIWVRPYTDIDNLNCVFVLLTPGGIR